MLKKILSTLLLLLSAVLLNAQVEEDRDSLVMLLSSKSAQVVEVDGVSFRKVIGPARFLHNNTYLLCDTAFWNVDSRVINAIGHVSVIQEETMLNSDKLTYYIDQDLCEFRGSLVSLHDKDHNELRTHNLDYNTKDSLATFFSGASMRDKDGQIIESVNGYYDSPAKIFTFIDDVNMFTDSIFVKTTKLEYESQKNLATFYNDTHVWKEDNMLSSQAGWYRRDEELFFFRDKVHVMSRDQEGWCDSLYFHRLTNDVDMFNNAQVNDTTRNVHALAGNINYVDSLSRVTLTRDPAVVSMVKERIMQADSTYKEEPDTVYLGADYMSYYTLPRYKIDSLVVVQAQERKSVLEVDPVSQFRRKAAEEAARAAEEAAKNDPNYHRPKPTSRANDVDPAVRADDADPAAALEQEQLPAEPLQETATDSLALASDSLALATDSLAVPTDSLALVGDSLAVATDSLALADSLAQEPLDTTSFGFLDARKNVKIFRKSMQVVCDSLAYSDLDSLARLFIEPIIYQEGTRQYTADSISIVVKNQAMDRASLMSNAFIALQEDEAHHDQIKSTEMMAYFDTEGELQRFDALGGAQALFYIEENDTIATVNKKESKMMSALFKNSEIDRIFYFDSPKSDAYPLAQLSMEERKLKGYAWQPEKRPTDRYAITALELRPGERSRYERVPKAKYTHTDRYFPGYMDDIYRQIQVRDSIKVIRERERALAEQEAERQARLDSLFRADSLAVADSLHRVDSLAKVAEAAIVKDSLARVDSLKKVEDLKPAADSILHKMTKKELRAYKKEQAKKEKAERKKKKQELREKKWKEMDARDEARRKAKAEKRLERERALKRKALQEIAEQERRDQKVYENYLKRYRKQAERDRIKAEQRRLRDEKKAEQRRLKEEKKAARLEKAGKAPAVDAPAVEGKDTSGKTSSSKPDVGKKSSGQQKRK